MAWTAYTWWYLVGFLGQILFMGRFLVEWLASGKEPRSTSSVHFWILSLAGSGIVLVYAIHRRDPVFILGQAAWSLICIRRFWKPHRASGSAQRPR